MDVRKSQYNDSIESAALHAMEMPQMDLNESQSGDLSESTAVEAIDVSQIDLQESQSYAATGESQTDLPKLKIRGDDDVTGCGYSDTDGESLASWVVSDEVCDLVGENVGLVASDVGQDHVSSDMRGPAARLSVRTDCLCDTVRRGDLLSLGRALYNPRASFKDQDVMDAITTAVSMDWAAAVAQLLPHMSNHRQEERLLSLLREAVIGRRFSAAETIINSRPASGGCHQLGETDLILAVQPGATVSFVRQFLAASDVNSQDLHGRTALSYAAQHGLAPVVRFLVGEARANPRIRDTQDWVPLQYALVSLESADGALREALGDIIEILSEP